MIILIEDINRYRLRDKLFVLFLGNPDVDDILQFYPVMLIHRFLIDEDIAVFDQLLYL